MGILSTVLIFLIVLTILVFVHEYGHFWVARRFGVKVETFSIGFGKELFGFNDKYETRWKFCAIPLGGYVKMFGDKDASSKVDNRLTASFTEDEKKQAFHFKPLHKKAAIVAAGPLANYIFAAIIFTGFFNFYGTPLIEPIITKILENSPADKAGIEIGDEIIKIDNNNIQSFSDIVKIMSLNTGDGVEITVKRREQVVTKQVHPNVFISKDILGNEIKSYKLGIMTEQVSMAKLSFFESIKHSVVECYNLSYMSLKAVGQIITGKRSVKELGGPIKIAQYTAKSAESGVASLLWFIALLSVNLGFMNLLPIPVLDGGHLLIYFAEFCFGKRIANKIQDYGFQIGLILLLILTLFVTYNDISSLNIFKNKG